MFARMLLFAVLAAFAATSADSTFAQEAQKQPAKKKQPGKKKNAVLAPIKDVPGLPRVLLIGDSISMGYTLPTRELLKGVANVHRPPTNCGPTIRGIEQIDQWLGDEKWDVIHFNFGLHDLKYIDESGKNTSPDKGKLQVPLAEYEKNLNTLVEKMKATGATVIFATTTPVPAGEPQRKEDSDKDYNAVAVKVMKKHNVHVNDLNALVRTDTFPGKREKNVHFTQEGSQKLAEQVAAEIKKALKK